MRSADWVYGERKRGFALPGVKSSFLMQLSRILFRSIGNSSEFPMEQKSPPGGTLNPLFIAVLKPLYDLIESHGDGAEDQDGRYEHIELEEIIAANDRSGHGSRKAAGRTAQTVCKRRMRAAPQPGKRILPMRLKYRKKFFYDAIKSFLAALYE